MTVHFPYGMTRRHFMGHLAGAAALFPSALSLANSFNSHAESLKRDQKSAILLWMGGGASSIDLWDLKPNSVTGGPFKPISTTGSDQICEHLPQLAKQMAHLSIVRSMNTREADHNRGMYYMHTGYVPRPDIQHPGYGAVVARELAHQRPELEIPPSVSIGGRSVGAGYLGMALSPFVVDSSGQVDNLQMGVPAMQMDRRLSMLRLIESRFVGQGRGQSATDHAQVLEDTRRLLTSKQMEAFSYRQEQPAMIDRYGDTEFGRGCLIARRLVEVGVPFVEVVSGGWDHHQNIFDSLRNEKLPELDRAMSALVEDLNQRGLLANTAVIWMGEFGRTPRINADGGRDHWARSWSTVVGGAGFQGGLVVGETIEHGTEVAGESYSAQDLMASVCHALGISLETTYTSRNGRPMKIANSGKLIKELFS